MGQSPLWGLPFLFALGCQFETDFFASDFEEHNIKVNQNCLYIPSLGGQQHEKSKIHKSIDGGITAGRL